MAGKIANVEFMKRMSVKPKISRLAQLGLEYEYSPQVRNEGNQHEEIDSSCCSNDDSNSVTSRTNNDQ